MIVAGIGLRAEASVAALRAAFDAACDAAGPECSIALLVVLAEKAHIPAFRTFAREIGLPLQVIPRDAVIGIATPTQRPRIFARFGCGSLAEALALVAAGPDAELIVHRHVSPDGTATAAIARSTNPAGQDATRASGPAEETP